MSQKSRTSIRSALSSAAWWARQNRAMTSALSRNVPTCEGTSPSARSSSAPRSPEGSSMSSTSRVIAMAVTPSVRASIRCFGTRWPAGERAASPAPCGASLTGPF
nr:hypothetical protein [Streptomyces cinnamoneus]